MHSAQYLTPGMPIIFRDGHTTGIGRISGMVSVTSTTTSSIPSVFSGRAAGAGVGVGAGAPVTSADIDIESDSDSDEVSEEGGFGLALQSNWMDDESDDESDDEEDED